MVILTFVLHCSCAQTVDDEAMLRDIDFTPFEAQFQLQARREGKKSQEKRTQAINKYANQIRFVEPNRAKNMSEPHS